MRLRVQTFKRSRRESTVLPSRPEFFIQHHDDGWVNKTIEDTDVGFIGFELCAKVLIVVVTCRNWMMKVLQGTAYQYDGVFKNAGKQCCAMSLVALCHTLQNFQPSGPAKMWTSV